MVKKQIMMYVEEGLKQFYIATEDGWQLMPGSRFYVAQETKDGRVEEPFAVLFDSHSRQEFGEVGLMVMAERTGAPFNAPHYVKTADVLATGTGIAETADAVIQTVLGDFEGELPLLQQDIEKRREEIFAQLGPMP